MDVQHRKVETPCIVAIVQLVFHTKNQKRIEWDGDRYEILNSWHDQEGKIDSVHGHHYCVRLTEAASMTRNVAWRVMTLGEHLVQETRQQCSPVCWGWHRETRIQVCQPDVSG